MPNIEKAGELVQEWLHGEEAYQLGKFDAIYEDELVERRRFISDEEMPNKWVRSEFFRVRGIDVQANQQLLKVCAGTRAVLIYDRCIDGATRTHASAASFDILESHIAGLESVDLPPSYLLRDRNYDFAVRRPTSESTFLRAVDLAIVATVEYAQSRGEMRLPAPGVTSGEVDGFIS